MADRVAGGGAQLAPQAVELLDRSSPAARRGESRARHSVSSASRLPTPAITPWSSSSRLQRRASRGRRARGTRRGSTSAASGPTCEKSGSITARPSRRLSRSAIRPPSANSSTKRSQRLRRRLLVDRDPAGHAEVQAEIGPAVVGLRPQELPAPVRGGQPPADQRRRDLARARAGGRRRCRVSSTATISRPSARSICWRARSASGSSGMPYAAPAPVVVELPHRHRARRRGVDAEPAEHALVEVRLDDLERRRRRRRRRCRPGRPRPAWRPRAGSAAASGATSTSMNRSLIRPLPRSRSLL